MTSDTKKTRADFEAKLATIRAAIAQRHAQRTLKAKADVEAAQLRAAAKAKRRADAQAAATEERRAASAARADELRRERNQVDAEARQAALPKAPVADAFPEILSDGIVRAELLAEDTWRSLHQNAQRRLLRLSRPEMSPADAVRAVRLLDMTANHLRANVRQEIFDRATRTQD